MCKMVHWIITESHYLLREGVGLVLLTSDNQHIAHVSPYTEEKVTDSVHKTQ